MAKFNALHQLVLSLTKSEKRFIKLNAQMHKGDKMYLKLMDAIAKQKEYNEEELLKLFEGEDFIETAEAMDESEILKIPKEDFLELLFKNRDVSNRFIKMLAHNVVEKEERLLNLAYDSVRKRVATALSSLQKKYQEADESQFEIAISRNELASIVGTSTETVIRTLSDFKDEGLISIKGSKIIIVKGKELEHLRF